jgi:hypothetical protein
MLKPLPTPPADGVSSHTHSHSLRIDAAGVLLAIALPVSTITKMAACNPGSLFAVVELHTPHPSRARDSSTNRASPFLTPVP